jgi:hypothetical protein
VKKNKLKIKKFRGGGMDMGNAANQAQSAAMGNAGNAGNVNLGDTGPEGSESITSFKDNYATRFKSKGLRNLMPGSQIANTIGAIRDTAIGMKAMGMDIKPTQQINNSDNSNNTTCPPGQRMQNGTCVPAGGTAQAQRLSEGGEFSFNKIVQQDYYKDLI